MASASTQELPRPVCSHPAIDLSPSLTAKPANRSISKEKTELFANVKTVNRSCILLRLSDHVLGPLANSSLKRKRQNTGARWNRHGTDCTGWRREKRGSWRLRLRWSTTEQRNPGNKRRIREKYENSKQNISSLNASWKNEAECPDSAAQCM